MKKRIVSLVTAFALAVTAFCGLELTGGSDEVYAAAKAGGLLWHAKASGSNMQGMCAPAVDADGYVYVAAGKELYKYDGADGKLAGSVTLPASIGYNKMAPELGGGYVFVALGGAQVSIVDAASMRLVKTVTYAAGQTGHQSITPVEYSAADNAIYLGSWRKEQGGTYAKVSLSDYTVTTLADSDTGFYWAGACADGDYVVFGSNAPGSDATPSTGDAVLFAYNKATGELLRETLSDSGSICSSVVKSGNAYYFTGKNKKLYKAVITAEGITVNFSVLGGDSTSTPLISDDGQTAYVGFASGVNVIDLKTLTVTKSYTAPADVKGLALSGGRLFATYNKTPGGIYDVMGGTDYFIPETSMQQYCVSSIAKSADGGILYYTNDSNTLMAVKEGVQKAEQKVTLKKVKGIKVSKKSKKAVIVKWKDVSGESGYQIARSTKKTKGFKVIKTVRENKKTVTIKAKKNKKYYYKVRAYIKTDSGKVYGPWSKVKAYKLK